MKNLRAIQRVLWITMGLNLIADGFDSASDHSRRPRPRQGRPRLSSVVPSHIDPVQPRDGCTGFTLGMRIPSKLGIFRARSVSALATASGVRG